MLTSLATPALTPAVPAKKEKASAAIKSHKRLKLRHEASAPEIPAIDLLDQFLEKDVIRLDEHDSFDVIQYWNDRYYSQPDLARMALDVLAVPPMSDECERLFSSAKMLLTDRRSRLKMDIIEASECLRSWYGPPTRNTFDGEGIGRLEGEPDPQETGQQGGGDADTEMDSAELQIVDQDDLLDEDDIDGTSMGIVDVHDAVYSVE